MRHAVPTAMSTQHPDNVFQPFFVENGLIGGEDEIQEAFYAYSHLGCDEQMWDFEGKEVDNFVVKKLLTKNESFFREKKLGQDVRLTLRVPNPEVEKAEGKILLETLESIPRSYDAAKLFYGADIAPIIEVILPMTTSSASLDRVYRYYADFVAGKQGRAIRSHDVSVGEWIGEFFPKTINVIPLFEDKEHMLASADMVREYLKDKDVPYQRVFLARSDPAVNYGSIPAVLINKIALARLYTLSKEINTPIYPILGAGSAPFRGNLRPQTVEQLMKGYPSVHTFTIQSSFKFDHDPSVVQKAIETLRTKVTGEPIPVDEARMLAIVDKYVDAYRADLKPLVPAIHAVAPYVPKRRKRKLHIGLFGYSRQMDEMSLPRAITFTASLYSLGVPPELLGLNALTDEDMRVIEEVYPHVLNDLRDAVQYADFNSPFFPIEIIPAINFLLPDIQFNNQHIEQTARIASIIHNDGREDVTPLVHTAAGIRTFLG